MRKLLLILFIFLSFSIPSMADEYYLGQWECEFDGQEYVWSAPDNVGEYSAKDMRSLTELRDNPCNSQVVGTLSNGYAIFIYKNKVINNNLLHLGNENNQDLSSEAKRELKSKLNIEGSIESNKVHEVIYELLTEEADPTGKDRWRPLMPKRDGRIYLRLGGDGVVKQVKVIPWVSPEWRNVLAVHHEDYRWWINNYSLAHVARILDALEDEYGVSYEYFIAPNSIRLASLPHNTTIGDTFTDTNGTLCDAHTATGANGGFEWFETSAGLEIQGNRMVVESGDNFGECRAESDLSSADMYTLLLHYNLDDDSGDGGDAVRLLFRYADDAREGYVLTFDPESSGVSIIWRRYDNGSATNLSTGNYFDTYDDGEELKVEMDGSDMEAFHEGVSFSTESDSTYSAYVRAGVAAQDDGAIDNWEAGDLGAAPSPLTHIPQIMSY